MASPHWATSLYGRGRRARRSGASTQGVLSTWTNSTVSQREAERQLERTGERSLDLYHNDAMAHGVMESLLVGAIGIGLTPQPSPKADWIGMDDEADALFQAQAARVWEEHGLDCRHWCDAQRRLDYYGLQGLGYFNWKLLGVGPFQVVAKKRLLAPLSTCLLPIDPFRMVSPSGLPTKEIYDGVQIDSDGEPVRVWLKKPGVIGSHPTKGNCESFPVWDDKTGLPRILLITDVRNVAEYRQDSILGSMIPEIQSSHDLSEAAVIRAALQNLFTMFVNDFGQGKITKETPWDKRIFDTPKGTILVGSGKEKPTFFQHEAAPARYSEMFSGIIDRLGMATGRGAENVVRKFQASYSASKASMEMADQFNEFEHRTVIGQFCQPFWAWMLYEAALRSRLTVKSIKHFKANLYAYTHAEHLPQPSPQIDQEKAAKSNVLKLGANITNYRTIYGKAGKDWRAELRQNAAEKKYIKELEEEFDVDMSSYEIPESAWKNEEKSDAGKDES